MTQNNSECGSNDSDIAKRLKTKERKKELYLSRKEKGICVQCGQKPVVDTKIRCIECTNRGKESSNRPEHKSRAKESKNKLYLSRRELGLCERCGENPLHTKHLCIECSKKYTKVTKQRRQKKKEDGICTVCGKNPLHTETLCVECNDRARKASIRSEEKKVAAGLCGSCGEHPLHSNRLCVDCYDKSLAATRRADGIRRADRGEKGLCKKCGGEAIPGRKMCQSCADKDRIRYENNCAARDAAGLCRNCGKNPKRNLNEPSSLCKRCCLRAIANGSLGSVKRADDLKTLWICQKGICAETGLKLTIGENASVDHILATSKGGTHDIENLRCVHACVNFAKSNLSTDEFHEFVKMVAVRNNLLSGTEGCKEVYQMFLEQKAIVERQKVEIERLKAEVAALKSALLYSPN